MSNGLSELRGQAIWNAVSEADKAYQAISKILGSTSLTDRSKISILAAVETYVNATTKERLLREKV
jgi:hypothetical protein